ncbi:monovalent cation/H+ antiporter complex subunit F [Sulfurospirillum sp. 1612]|uniref:monovalent cation/H+ antiporter complex subunit F n=1 Tax=Sulfurospirillum sp. 1612 TaxID=3094835 RepID=UPI002F948FD6
MLNILILLIALSLLLALIRFLKGPTLVDRVVAFDSMSVITAAMLVVLSFYFKKSLYLDVAFVFGLIGFVGTVVFAKFLDKEI